MHVTILTLKKIALISYDINFIQDHQRLTPFQWKNRPNFGVHFVVVKCSLFPFFQNSDKVTGFIIAPTTFLSFKN